MIKYKEKESILNQIWLFQIISYLLKRGKKSKKKLILYDSAINIHIISYLLTQKRKEREKSFLFCLYDSAINIHVFISMDGFETLPPLSGPPLMSVPRFVLRDNVTLRL
jgi:hypothetical protein